jgi:alkanesulfonate monooxygenase SsuD/methylene tetrahydromethanopterin reductase-like flavin-dependent oxidoreductase (luciferase family)
MFMRRSFPGLWVHAAASAAGRGKCGRTAIAITTAPMPIASLRQLAARVHDRLAKRCRSGLGGRSTACLGLSQADEPHEAAMSLTNSPDPALREAVVQT